MSRPDLLTRILAPGGIAVVFQPIFEVGSGRLGVHAFECLARGPRGTNLESPNVLFEYARRKHSEIQVDRYCVRNGLEASTALPAGAKLSLNVHAVTLERDREFPVFLQEAARASGVAPTNIIVEIVEHAPPWDTPAFAAALDELRGIGAAIALDDVGCGHSNFRMILDTRPDYFKADGYVVRGCHADVGRLAVVESLVRLATRAGATVVAEGVEDVRDLQVLVDAGVTLIQGWLLAAAAPAADASAAIASAQRAFPEMLDRSRWAGAQRSAAADASAEGVRVSGPLLPAQLGRGTWAAIAPALLEGLPSGLLVVDRDLRIMYGNRRAADLLGVASSRLPGSRLADHLPLVAAQITVDGRNAAELLPRRFVLERADGTHAMIGLRSQPCDKDAETNGLNLLVFQDITDQEVSLSKQGADLQFAAVAEVMPAVLHTLKNPLAGITAAVEVLSEEDLGESVLADLRSILRELLRMRLTLEGVGLFNLSLKSPHNADLRPALAEVCATLEGRSSLRGIRTRFAIPELPPLPFDPAAARALLFNLLNNAVEASRPDDEVSVRVAIADAGRTFRLQVDDTGPGMTPHVLSKCRELFFTTKPNGGGIGLALCQAAIDRAGGELQIDSGPNAGTRVTVTLPVAILHDSVRDSARRITSHATSDGGGACAAREKED